MSDAGTNEKDYATDTAAGSDYGSAAPEIFERPKGLKGFYYNPYTQVFMLGFVCFMGPGLFNALNGLGGGGQITTTVSANANVALYSVFAVVAFFAGYVRSFLHQQCSEC